MKTSLHRTAFAARRHVAAAVLALVAGAALAQVPAPAKAPAAATASGPAQAASRAGMGPGAMRGEMHGGRHAEGHGEKHEGRRAHDPAAMQQRFDRHMADLKQSLQLTPAQEPAWNQFTSAMRPPATPPARPDQAAMASMTTPQRLEQMQAMRQQHQAEMDKHTAAVRAFYATLTPEQQKRFDAQTARQMRGHDGMRGQHHHG